MTRSAPNYGPPGLLGSIQTSNTLSAGAGIDAHVDELHFDFSFLSCWAAKNARMTGMACGTPWELAENPSHGHNTELDQLPRLLPAGPRAKPITTVFCNRLSHFQRFAWTGQLQWGFGEGCYARFGLAQP